MHHFLRRHVYGASRPHVSRNMATLITFLISAFGHELVMGCITKKLRGYGFLAQMMQLPIVALQRTKFVRGRRLFNNVCFWVSMILGLSMVCVFFFWFSLFYPKTGCVGADRKFLDVCALCPCVKTCSF